MNNVNNRLDFLSRSEIRIMSIECEKVGGINLSQGICDLPLSPILYEETNRAILSGNNHYTRHDGIIELRQSISEKMKSYNHLEYDAESEIIVTSGSTAAFYCACLSLLNPDDEVILFEPFYGYHEYTLKALGIVPVYAHLTPPSWSFDMDSLEKLITPKTKGIMINTPSNPCGKIFSMSELNALGQFSKQHNLFIFTDEIYEYIVYDGVQHISPASIPSLHNRTITISGYSKTFSITGWRIGYCACRRDLAEQIGCAHDLVYVCAPAPLQIGVSKAISALPQSYYDNLRDSFEKKRNVFCDALKSVSLTPYAPQGAYYVLADCSALKGNTAKEKAMYLLEKTGVASVPGSAFYHNENGENLLRFCFAKDDSVIDEACERLYQIRKYI
ncbi:MAG: aminotransferase [Oscillospiraceae bacterium]|nr:aminotransferase [Oscillospiraceae bacterium]